MSENNFSLKSEQGFVFVASLLILIILVVIGIASLNVTTIDIQIAANEKFHKIAFYNADSGVYTAPKVISETIETDADPNLSSVTIFGADESVYIPDFTKGTGRFYREIKGFVSDGTSDVLDMQFSLGNYNVDVDIAHAGSHIIVGGGAEFASGSSGVGVGSTGGVEIWYDMASDSIGPSNALADIGARYRKVPGTAGGL